MLFRLISETVKQNCLDYIKSLLAVGDKEIVIREKRRSLDQNAYYWNVVCIIADFNGTHKDDMHDQLRLMFLGAEEFAYNGKIYHRPKSTRNLTTKEFSEYLDKVIAVATALGLVVPTKDYFGG